MMCAKPKPALETRVTTALVVYRSHTGVTRRYGEAIAAHLRTRGIDATVASVGDCDMASLAGVDYLFLGCWTSGMFVVMQHPDGPWLSFVRAMPKIGETAADGTARPSVALFTTYQLRTGSQFPRMRAALRGKTPDPRLELKSRNGALSDKDRRVLDEFTTRQG
jgi:sulfite reductase alpha subunit-like flavoprotein